MRWIWILPMIAITAGCGGAAGASSGPPDADTTVCECFQERGCQAGKGRSTVSVEVPCELWTPTFCDDQWSYSCTSGCAVESVGLGAELGPVVDPAIFCAETPAAQVGDDCGRGCLPTRATVDGAGAVTQAYLACDQASDRCVAAPPPIVSGWMAPCPHAAATWGTPGVNGRASGYEDGGDFCLLAWDAPTGTVASGRTITCLGDWDCPAGAMCDDHVTHLELTDDEVQAVCRPGARGTPIDPASLHP